MRAKAMSLVVVMLASAVAYGAQDRDTTIAHKESAEDLMTGLMCKMVHLGGPPPNHDAGLKKEAEDKRAACVAAGGNPAAGDAFYQDAQGHMQTGTQLHFHAQVSLDVGHEWFQKGETHYFFLPPEIPEAEADYGIAWGAYEVCLRKGEKETPNAVSEYNQAIDGYNQAIIAYEAATPQPPPGP